MADWLDTPDWQSDSPAPPPRPPVITKAGENLCCPTCGSVKVHAKDNGRTIGFSRWECACGAAWKLPGDLVIVRCYTISSG